jgi:hypothetical protein
MKNYIYCVFIGLLSFSAYTSFAQSYDDEEMMKQLGYVDQLLTDAADYYYDEDKLENNQEVIAILSEILESDNAFDLPWDSLNTISVIRSEDEKLLIMTWNVLFDDLHHTCFGFIQYQPNKNELYTYRLSDLYILEDSVERRFMSHKEWYGAVYYDIIENKDRANKTQYTLLGWRGRDALTQQKLIETLEFDRHNLPIFGNRNFIINRKKVERAIFTYSLKTQMLLYYNTKHNLLVFDHLSPSNPKLIGHFEFYGPDLSYDAFKYEKGKWYFNSDIDPEIAINYEMNKNMSKFKNHKPSTDF